MNLLRKSDEKLAEKTKDCKNVFRVNCKIPSKEEILQIKIDSFLKIHPNYDKFSPNHSRNSKSCPSVVDSNKELVNKNETFFKVSNKRTNDKPYNKIEIPIRKYETNIEKNNKNDRNYRDIRNEENRFYDKKSYNRSYDNHECSRYPGRSNYRKDETLPKKRQNNFSSKKTEKKPKIFDATKISSKKDFLLPSPKETIKLSPLINKKNEYQDAEKNKENLPQVLKNTEENRKKYFEGLDIKNSLNFEKILSRAYLSSSTQLSSSKNLNDSSSKKPLTDQNPSKIFSIIKF